MKQILNKLYTGDSDAYEFRKSVGLILDDVLYIIENSDTHTKAIYKGTKKICGDFDIINGDAPSDIEEGHIYYITEFSDGDNANPHPFVGFWDGSEWISFNENMDSKQDKLTAGEGIEITEENVINSTIDLSLYKIVSELPTTEIDDNKIYLVLNTTSETSNKYIEYIHHTEGWEKLGEYKAEIPLNDYLKIADADKKYIPKTSGGTSGSTISISTNGSFNNYGNNGQAFNAVRDLSGTTEYQTATGSGYPLNAASFGVKNNGTTAFSHKKYDSFNKDTGATTGAVNTAVLVFSGKSGLLYAKNTGSGKDVTDDMYRYVGVIDSPDEKQRVYSANQVDELIKGLTDTIAALEARVQALENK